jgi:hypothetical protein
MFEMFDWESISAAVLVLVNGIPLVLVLLGLVYAAGEKFGIQGKWQFLLSLGLGLIFGVGYQLSISGPYVGYAGWFGYVVYGLFLGLLASWIYDTAKDLLSKVIEKMLGFTDHAEG